MQYPDYNFPSPSGTIQNDRQTSSSISSTNHTGNGINLQIGGLLSTPLSMQRSMINDVSPPSSLASSSMSFNDCGNSLITSGDFSNISCLLNNNQLLEEDLLLGNRLKTTIELTYPTKISDFDDSKDNYIAKTDMHGIEEHSSGNSTLQNSMELDKLSSNNTFCANNETFKMDQGGNMTFDKSGGILLNQTFDDIGQANNTFVKIESKFLTEQSPERIGDKTVTIEHVTPESNIMANSSPVSRNNPKLPIQSTPAVGLNRAQKFATTIEVEDLSPITTHPATIRRKSRLTVEPDDDNKRISLQNFEDVEKSISLLENTHDEEGFDIILEDITDLKRSLDMNDKLKQSLQNIKNRHSQANFEKQQEELLSKRRIDMNGTMTLDNKILESMNKSMSSSNGSERLLNRRSRLDDDFVMPVQDFDQSKVTQAVAQPLPSNNTDRKSNRDRFKTIRIVKKHIEGMVVVDAEDDEEEDEGHEYDPNNQKTISQQKLDETFIQQPLDTDDCFKKPEIPQRPLGSTLPFRGRSLSKPKVYSGLYATSNKKDMMSLKLVGKASSIDHLDSNRVDSQENISCNRTMTLGNSTNGINSNSKHLVKPGKLKSPMGAKSKSYHNLVFSNPTNCTISGLKTHGSTGNYVSKYGQGPMKASAGSDQVQFSVLIFSLN